MTAKVPKAASLELREQVSLFSVALDGGRQQLRDHVLSRLIRGPGSVLGCPASGAESSVLKAFLAQGALQFYSSLVEGTGSILNPTSARISGLPVFPLNSPASLSILFRAHLFS